MAVDQGRIHYAAHSSGMVDSDVFTASRWKELAHFAAQEGSYSIASKARKAQVPCAKSGLHQWQRLRRKVMPLIRNRGLLLQQEHWLEVMDRKHRYGSDLRVYFEFWLSLRHSDRSFFMWLDGPEGRSVDLPECPRSKLEESRVKYCSAEEAAQLEVIVDDAGLLRYKLSGELLDTRAGFGVTRAQAEQAEATTEELVAGGDFSLVYAPKRQTNGGSEDGAAVALEAMPADKATQAASCSAASCSIRAVFTTSTYKEIFRHHLDVAALRGTVSLARTSVDACKLTQTASSLGEAEGKLANSMPVGTASGNYARGSNEAQAAGQSSSHPSVRTDAGCGIAPPATACDYSVDDDQSAAGQQPDAHTQFAQAEVAERIRGQTDQRTGTTAEKVEEGGEKLTRCPSFVVKDDGTVKPKDSYIYVLDTEQRLYVARKVRGYFHHSSFLRGVPLIAAGGIRVYDGELLRITAMSGHYKPSQEDIDRLVEVLGNQGVDMDKVTVLRHVKNPKPNKTNYLSKADSKHLIM